MAFFKDKLIIPRSRKKIQAPLWGTSHLSLTAGERNTPTSTSPFHLQTHEDVKNQDLSWCHNEISCITSNLVFVQWLFSPSYKHRLLIRMLQCCDGELQMWEKKVRASSILPPSLPDMRSHPTSPLPGNQLLDWGEGRRWYSISGLWITVPCSVFFLWWFGCLAGWLAEGLTGCMRRKVLWSGPQCRGTDWETWTGGCWVSTWPKGCLFKPKTCLDCCTQTLLLYCSCMRHKGRELEGDRKRKRELSWEGEKQEERGDLYNVIPRSQETAQTIRKMREPSGAEEGTAQGHTIIRHRMPKDLCKS